MNAAARLLTHLRIGSRLGVDPQAIRAETWALGGRHLGRVRAGALAEMRVPGVAAKRIVLLKAVIRSLPAAGAGDEGDD